MTNRPSVLEVINNFQIVKIIYINAPYTCQWTVRYHSVHRQEKGVDDYSIY